VAAAEGAGFDAKLLGSGGEARLLLAVGGMVCAQCSAAVEACLRGRPGVSRACASLISNQAEARPAAARGRGASLATGGCCVGGKLGRGRRAGAGVAGALAAAAPLRRLPSAARASAACVAHPRTGPLKPAPAHRSRRASASKAVRARARRTGAGAARRWSSTPGWRARATWWRRCAGWASRSRSCRPTT